MMLSARKAPNSYTLTILFALAAAAVAVVLLQGCTQLPINNTDPVASLQTQVTNEVALVTLAEAPLDALIIAGKIKGKDADAIVAFENTIDAALSKAGDAAVLGQATTVADQLSLIRSLKANLRSIYTTYTVPATQPTTQPQ